VHTIGGVMSAGESITLILPEANDMVMQARIKPQEIDQVQAGQVTPVKFPAFNLMGYAGYFCRSDAGFCRYELGAREFTTDLYSKADHLGL
jgi:hypothetical protein